MCGIAGYAGTPMVGTGAAAALGERMCATLTHRGPDDVGVWSREDGAVMLAQRRLSIIDLSPLGHNPMPWDGGRLWITFNGEIYNFRELRRQLEAAGHRFRSQTDTEVILAAYDEWGLDCVQRFAGMFAFALWDEPRRRLWLVRDRLGKKPLYYTERNGSIRFASELKAIVADETFPRDIDVGAVGLYLRYGYVPSPSTIYAAARKLPPGHALLLENGRVSISRYWDPVPFALSTARVSAADAEAELEARLATAVSQRMIADVPLGAFLSGGIDSSLVVALMQEHSAAPVRTFTIRFENPEYNEADHAAAVARHLGTEHHERTCDEREMLDVVERLPDMFDEPFADSSAVPTYLVSKTARELVNLYAKRWEIECQFRDSKDIRYGMGMGEVHVSTPARRDRLWLVNALAVALLTLLGAAGEALGFDRMLKSNTAKRRTHSLLRQGIMLHQLIPTMPKHRLLPLVEKFAELLEGQPLFADMFGAL